MTFGTPRSLPHPLAALERLALVAAFALYVGAVTLELLERLYVGPLVATIARLQGVA